MTDRKGNSGIRLVTTDDQPPSTAQNVPAEACALEANRTAIEGIEQDPDRGEREKNIAALVVAAELAHAAGWPWEASSRLVRMATALICAQEGAHHPVLAPTRAASGTVGLVTANWRIYCILAVKARRQADKCGLKQAQKAFLRDIGRALQLRSGHPGLAILFPERDGSSCTQEIDRRCNLLSEWAKSRTLERSHRLSIQHHQGWNRLLDALGPNGWMEAYQSFLQQAGAEARALTS